MDTHPHLRLITYSQAGAAGMDNGIRSNLWTFLEMCTPISWRLEVDVLRINRESSCPHCEHAGAHRYIA